MPAFHVWKDSARHLRVKKKLYNRALLVQGRL